MSKKIENKFPIEDLDRMLKLFKHVGPLYQEQQDLIFEMLKKYIDPNHPRPLAACNCNLSYGNAFNKLRDWVSLNGSKFK
jgi:hypothetical protein